MTADEVEDFRVVLSGRSADDYNDWVWVGQAMSGLGDEGFELWNEWSSKSDKYDAEAAHAKWNTFSGGSSRVATALANVWINPPFSSPIARLVTQQQQHDSILSFYEKLRHKEQ